MVDRINRVITELITKVKGLNNANKQTDAINKQSVATGRLSARTSTLSVGIGKATKRYRLLGKSTEILTRASDKFGISVDSLRRGMGKGELVLTSYAQGAKASDKNSRLFKRTQEGITEILPDQKRELSKLNSKYKEFNFRLLGGLFLGQALSNTFLGLFKGTKQLAGIFDSIATIIGAALLPAFLPVALFLLDLATKFLNLPEPIRKFIGYLALGIGVLGLLVTTIAAVGLGFEGFKLGIEILFTPLTKLISFIKKSTAVQWAWNAAMTANPAGLVVIGLALIVAGLVSITRKSQKVRDFFEGWKGQIIGLINPIVYLVNLINKLIDAFQGKNTLQQGFDNLANESIFGRLYNKFTGNEITGRPTLKTAPVSSGFVGPPERDNGFIGPPEREVIQPNQSPNFTFNIQATDSMEIMRQVNSQLSAKLRGVGIR